MEKRQRRRRRQCQRKVEVLNEEEKVQRVQEGKKITMQTPQTMTRTNLKMVTQKWRRTLLLLLLLLPLLAEGLPASSRHFLRGNGRRRNPPSGAFRSGRLVNDGRRDVCDRDFQKRYCDAPFGGDLHTACRQGIK
jgi:hypothetical protein